MRTAIHVILYLALLWIPGSIGGIFYRYDWEWPQSIALLVLLLITAGIHQLQKQSTERIKWWIIYTIVLVNTTLITFSLMVSAAWVYVPPFTLMYIAVATVFFTSFLKQTWRLPALLITTTYATLVFSFGTYLSYNYHFFYQL